MSAAVPPAAPGRIAVAGLGIGALVLFVLADLRDSAPIDPFAALPPAALGSGMATDAAHCAAPAPG